MDGNVHRLFFSLLFRSSLQTLRAPSLSSALLSTKPPDQPWPPETKKGTREGMQEREGGGNVFVSRGSVRASSSPWRKLDGEEDGSLRLSSFRLLGSFFPLATSITLKRREIARSLPRTESERAEVPYFHSLSTLAPQSRSPTIQKKDAPRFFLNLPLPSTPTPTPTPPLHRSSSTSPPPGAAPAA